MRRRTLAIMICAALLLSPARAMAVGVTQPPSAGEDVTAADLVSMTSGMDGRTVHLRGEVISEVLSSDHGHVWVNVLSDGIGIGLWMPRGDADAIGAFGSYRYSGDILEVAGVFNEACDQHGGDLDIHVEAVDVIQRGKPIDHPISYWKIGLGVAGLLGARLLLRRRREGQLV